MGISIDVLHATTFESLVDSLKVSIAALREADVPFLLGGSFAAWARGGPEPANDLDFMVRPGDAERSLAALAEAGMRPERPPEEWLFKAWHGDVLIDLIFHPAGLELTDEVFDRADWMPVMAVNAPVMALDDVLTTKLNALDEHSLDYTQLLAISRALREQIDWRMLQARCTTAYARAFFTLVQELGIAPAPGQAAAGHPPAQPRVRVIGGDGR